MIKFETISLKQIKPLLFWLLVIEVVVIYYAFTEEFVGLLIDLINCELSLFGYLFSVEGPIKFIAKLILPSYLLMRFFKSTRKEEILDSFKKLYDKISTWQLLICLILFSVFWFYIHKFYSILYKKYKKICI